ncbi:hypothetical protein Q9966_001903 [Columba livia]|nr:hypothetical protein Q9966_001903 [Columba livia]
MGFKRVIKRTLAWTGNESGTLEININLLMSCPDVLRNPFFSSTLWYFSNQQLGSLTISLWPSSEGTFPVSCLHQPKDMMDNHICSRKETELYTLF